MNERSLLRRSPNSLSVLIALAVALLTVIIGVILLLATGLRRSNWSVDSQAFMLESEAEFASALHLPVIVLLGTIGLLLVPLLWRYRRRARRAAPPEL